MINAEKACKEENAERNQKPKNKTLKETKNKTLEETKSKKQKCRGKTPRHPMI
ncbi:MAG: hypothetical protein UHP28_02870 [Treponema sp.]|nr:hypothetical protein [Treponema sp.]